MAGLLFGLLFATFLYFSPSIVVQDRNFLDLSQEMMIAFSLLFLFLSTLIFIFAWGPLQKASSKSSPLLLSLFKKDLCSRWIYLWFFLFTLFSLFLGTYSFLDKNKTVALWIILFGISFECLSYQLKIIFNYLDPFSFLHLLKKEALKDIECQREVDLCDKFDGICEFSMKALSDNQPSLANNSLNLCQQLVQSFLEFSKSFSSQTSDTQTKAFGIKDKVSYTLSYLFQKIEAVFQKALKKGEETVLSFLITTMGKIIIYCAKTDMSLTLQPLILTGKFATKSLEHSFLDVGLRATFSLLQVAKIICSEIDLKYLEIQDSFLCLINQLDKIAKESFKQDKSTKIALLVQPFTELKELFEKEPLSLHQDTPVILKDLNRILAEFEILETVMRTMPAPPLPQNPTTTA